MCKPSEGMKGWAVEPIYKGVNKPSWVEYTLLLSACVGLLVSVLEKISIWLSIWLESIINNSRI